MKKALAILMAIAMIVPAVFATGPAPEVTFGLSASAEVQMIKENTTDTFESSGDASKPAASFNPMGLKATKLVSNDWVNFDWAPMSIKAEAKYDAFRASADDYSWLKVTATWKDLFGFKIAYEYVQDNKEGAANPAAAMAKNTGNNISATYDKDGVKFWTKYNADDVLDMLDVSAGVKADSFLNEFKEIGFEFTNDEVATKLVYTNSTTGAYGAAIDAATIEAKNLFGFWTVLLNNADEIGYRLSLGSDSKVEPPQFKIGKDNKIQSATAANKAMNAKNTMKFGENLTVKATLVAPNADVTFTDWLKGDNALVGAEFVLADVGTLGAGAKISQDYVISTGATSGPKKFFDAAYALTNTGDVVKGSAFWVDAKLDKLLGEDKAVYVGVDAQLGYYNKAADTTKFGTDNPTKVKEVQVGNTTVIDLYGETKMKLSDMISFSAGALFSLGSGYDYKAVTGTSWSDVPTNKEDKDNNWYSGWTEANDLNAKYGITPFELKAQVDVKVNDTVSVWVKDNFKANAGKFDAAVQPAGGKGVIGFYQKNVLGLGAKLKATEKSSLSVSSDINMYLGLPAGSDLYLTGATDATKKAVDSSLAEWKSKNFNPFAVSVSYSYAY